MESFHSVLFLAAVLMCAGCKWERAGPTQRESRAIDRDNATLVRVNLDMGGGGLSVDSGTDKLAIAGFIYNVPSWKPEVRYSSSTGTGDLTIRQPLEVHSLGAGRTNGWGIRLNREVPLEVKARLDVGEAKLDLGGLNLRRVEIRVDMGNLDLDLRGSPKNSYDVRIHRSTGDTTVHLPSGVGVEVIAGGRVEDVEGTNLNEDEDRKFKDNALHGRRYYNDALGESNVTVRLDIQGGIGEIHLLTGK